MIRVLKKMLDFIIYGNLFVAASVVSALWLTALQWGLPVKLDTLALFVFSASVFDYTLQRMISTRKIEREMPTPLMAWMQSHLFAERLLLVVSGMASFVFFLQLPVRIYLPLLIAGLPALLYAFPLVFRTQSFRLRESAWLKIGTVAFVWAAVSVVLPYFYYEMHLPAGQWVLPFFERFLLTLALILPFEIRDTAIDNAYQFSNVAQRLGKKKTLRLAAAMVVAVFLLEVLRLFPPGPDDRPFLLAFAAAAAMALILFGKAGVKRSDYFYLILLDAVPVLLFLLLFLLL